MFDIKIFSSERKYETEHELKLIDKLSFERSFENHSQYTLILVPPHSRIPTHAETQNDTRHATDKTIIQT